MVRNSYLRFPLWHMLTLLLSLSQQTIGAEFHQLEVCPSLYVP